jgi:hypothetical protein
MRLAHFEAFHIPSQASKPTVQWFLKPEWFALAAPRALTACPFAVFQNSDLMFAIKRKRGISQPSSGGSRLAPHTISSLLNPFPRRRLNLGLLRNAGYQPQFRGAEAAHEVSAPHLLLRSLYLSCISITVEIA